MKPVILLLTLMIIAADQVTKYWAIKYLVSPLEVTSFFNLVFVMNRGVAFGLFSNVDSPLLPWALLGVTVCVFVIVLVWFARAREKLVVIGLGGVLAGTIGNGIDRYRWGAVVDFLDFHFNHWHWPAFNVADMSLVLGTFALLYGLRNAYET